MSDPAGLAIGQPTPWHHWQCQRGDAPALIDLHRSDAAISWRQLADSVDWLAGRLVSDAWAPGQRLVHAAGNSVDGVIVALASLATGLVEVPLDPQTPAAQRAAVQRRVAGRWFQASALLDQAAAGPAVDRRQRRRVDAAARISLNPTLSVGATLRFVTAADAPALILMTSGSRGDAKAVTLSRRNWLGNAAAKLAALPQSVDDVRLTLLPLWHAYARTCDLGTWLLSGSTLAIGLGWDGWQQLADDVRPTLVNTVPSLAERIAAQPSAAASWQRLRALGCGGAALGQSVFRQLSRPGVAVIQGYGMTEASPVICSATADNGRPGLVGQPVAGWQTRIDAQGRLSVRGPSVMLGYWEGTGPRPAAPWLDTGDLVAVDPLDGQYRIIGRADDRITLDNGRKVDPGMLEARLLMLPSLRHVLIRGCGRHLEVWIDVAPGSGSLQAWRRRIAQACAEWPVWQRPRRVRWMPVRPEQIAGAVTAKGTLVRPRILELIAARGRHHGADARPLGGAPPALPRPTP